MSQCLNKIFPLNASQTCYNCTLTETNTIGKINMALLRGQTPRIYITLGLVQSCILVHELPLELSPKRIAFPEHS